MIPSMNLLQLLSALPQEQNEFSSNEGIKYLQAFHHGQPDVDSNLNKLFHTAAITERSLCPLTQLQGESPSISKSHSLVWSRTNRYRGFYSQKWYLNKVPPRNRRINLRKAREILGITGISGACQSETAWHGFTDAGKLEINICKCSEF